MKPSTQKILSIFAVVFIFPSILFAQSTHLPNLVRDKEAIEDARRVRSLVVRSSREVGTVPNLNNFELVTDTDTMIEGVTFHLKPWFGGVGFLGNLIHALRRPESDEQIKLLVVVRDTLEAARARESLKRRGITNVDDIVRFRISVNPYYPWARDLYPAYRNTSKRQYTVHPAVAAANEPFKSLGPMLMESKAPWEARFVKNGLDSVLSFQGGDMTSDDTFVYIGRPSIEFMIQSGVYLSEEEVRRKIEVRTGRKLLVLPGADAHNDRYHMPLGEIDGVRTNLVADPVMTLEIIRSLTEEEKSAAIKTYVNVFGVYGEEMSPQIERFFNLGEEDIQEAKDSAYVRSLNSVQKTLEANGIRVIRIPTLHRRLLAEQHYPVGIYYINLLQDSYRNWEGSIRRAVIYPDYGIGPLDRKVLDIFKELGHFHEFKSVSGVWPGLKGAGVRCLVQTFGFPLDSLRNPD